MTIEGHTMVLLADSGATFSSVRHPFPPSSKAVNVVGVSGSPEQQLFSKPLQVKWQDYQVQHPFLLAPNCPVNLLGRDLMCKLRMSIFLSPDGIQVSTRVPKSTPMPPIRMLFLSHAALPAIQQVYWLRLLNHGLTPQRYSRFS